MPIDSADDLLERLARGEVAAAEGLFAAYAPFLRALVRCYLSNQVRAKLDSADVVQSVWVQVVRQLNRDGLQVSSESQLKALLATIARRRLVTRIRQFASSAKIRQGSVVDAMPDRRHPPPSEVAMANDLWERMLDLLPVDHHPVLVLRRDGMSLDEIATRTGLHEGSVRRILRQLSRDLALTAEPLDHPSPPG